MSGVVTITVTVMDSGGTANGAVDTVTQTFNVTVTPVNQQPTFTVTPPTAILENAGQQTVPVTGISVGQGDTATASATITAGAVSAITVTDGGNGYTSASLPTVTIAPPPSGGTQATASAIVNSNGVVTGFTITNPGSGYTSVPRIRIADGQALTITATIDPASENPALITTPVFSYTSGSTGSGVLTYTPAANAYGTATIIVTVMDTGGTANNGVDTLTQTFNVTVTQVNQPPTLDPIVVANPQILENAGLQTIDLTGISPGPGDIGETVTITATSNNPSVIPNPTIIFPPNNTTGMLTFTPVPFTYGSATITVSLTNSGLGTGPGLTTTQTFTVSVLHVNQPPTLDPIPNPAALLQNATLQTVSPDQHHARHRRRRADLVDHSHQQQHEL